MGVAWLSSGPVSMIRDPLAAGAPEVPNVHSVIKGSASRSEKDLAHKRQKFSVISPPPGGDPLVITSLYISPSVSYQHIHTDVEALFSLGNASIICRDFNAHHTSWGCQRNDNRGNIIKYLIDSTDTQIVAPTTPTRFGHNSASIIDFALTRNIHWLSQVDSIAELSSDHNPLIISFDTNTRFSFPRRNVSTDWATFRELLSPPHYTFHPITARTGEDVDTQVADLTDAIINTHALSSKSIRSRNSYYVSDEIRQLMIERNRARKTWQFTRDPSDKRVLNNIQNRIHRKVKAFQNKIWEDELRALDPDDGSLWEMSKELRKKKSPVYVLKGQGGIAHTDSDKAELAGLVCSEEVGSEKIVKPVIAPSSPAAKAADSVSAPGSSEKDDGFNTVGRNEKRIAPIVIDTQSNATELLDQIGKFCDTPLEGRFENGKLRVFPTSAEEHRLIQKFISDKKLRSHTFEMAHNKQLKVVLRGLPTDFNHEELMSELHTFGFKPNHISLLRNRKTNTNMPLFLVTLPKSPIAAARTLQTSRDAPRIPSTQNQTSQNRRRTSGKSERLRTRKLKNSQQHLPFRNWNANDLKSNLEELKECIIDYDLDVIGIQETHLRPADRVSIPNYTGHRSDRTTHRGGGTAIFVKNSIRHHAIVNTSNTFENTSVILQVRNNTKITVACIYRPPHGSINTIELDAILNHSNKAFLFSDFNAKHSSWNPGRSNTNGNILCNWAVGSALDILAPDTPTHFNSRHSNAIFDIGFAVNLSHTDVFTINALSSDHNPVIFDFVTNNVLPPILRTLKSTNWTKFQEIIYHNIPGNPRIDDLDLAVQNFISNISNAISASTSTRLINTPHLRLPENIRELIRAKNRFRKLWNNTRYPPYKREVNALIRQIRSEIQEHKNRTWKDFLLTLNPEDNSLYNLHRKFSKRHIPFPPLHGSGGMAYSDFEKAEAFKDTLEVTFQENEEPYCDDKIEEVENLVDDYFDNFATCTVPLTSPSEVRGIIKKLQNRKAAGPDQIPNIAFKYFTLNALTHLTKLYNQSLIKNHFPTLWKQANVIMLAKPNQDRTYPQGYRPISLINATAKIFERIILTRIKSHCKAIDCIPPEQCGFREGHSTLHQLMRVTNIINEGFAHKFYTVGVFLDVKRAFYKMWHDGLTYKLIKLHSSLII
ncbi:probable RNA-directed DNA polymerase from transposon X-element [Trichonephila clavipes]|nr:probable RNA-directed DNA polymerase from transposon X-element [Trichonephila clavipes]